MRRSGALLIIAALALPLEASATPATAARARLATVASNSVLAVSGPSSTRTGFAFDDSNTAIVFATAGETVRLTTSAGGTTLAHVGTASSGLVALASAHMGVSPLPATRIQHTRNGAIAYVLGPPLGYEADRIRTVRLPAVNLRSQRTVQVSGSLPTSFQGAPVVTRGGNLLGAVAGAAAHRWTLAPRARLLRMATAARHPASGGGLPVAVMLALGVAAALLAMAAVAATIRRRRRAVTTVTDGRRAQAAALSAGGELIADPARATGASAAPVSQGDAPAAIDGVSGPLVRRRDHAEETAEEFEVILKSREQP